MWWGAVEEMEQQSFTPQKKRRFRGASTSGKLAGTCVKCLGDYFGNKKEIIFH